MSSVRVVLLVLGAVLLGACSRDDVPTFTVVNDLPREVTLQLCVRQHCDEAERDVVEAGERHSYPIREVAVGESADEVRITDGSNVHCVLVPPPTGDGNDDAEVLVSTFVNEPCDHP